MYFSFQDKGFFLLSVMVVGTAPWPWAPSRGLSVCWCTKVWRPFPPHVHAHVSHNALHERLVNEFQYLLTSKSFRLAFHLRQHWSYYRGNLPVNSVWRFFIFCPLHFTSSQYYVSKTALIFPWTHHCANRAALDRLAATGTLGDWGSLSTRWTWQMPRASI